MIFNPGETLSNGAIIICGEKDVILAIKKGCTQAYVVWRVDCYGDLYDGCYTAEIDTALAEFNERVL